MKWANLTCWGVGAIMGWGLATLVSRVRLRQLLRQSRSLFGGDPEPVDLEDALRRVRERIDGLSRSERRDRAELEAVLESVIAPIVAVDLREEILFCNSKFREDFGAESAVGSRLAEIVRESDVLAAFRWALKHGDLQETEVEILVRDRVRIYTLEVQPLRVGREALGAVGVLLDVTAVRHAERMQTDFVANVSHELRTPLTSIKGFAEAMPPQGPGVEAIRRNVDRMLSLVHDLMDLAHLEAGSGLRQRRFSPQAMVEAATLQLMHRFPDVRSRVVCEVQGEFTGDAKLIEQVVINLLENALLYSGGLGPIEMHWSQEGSRQVLRVRDHGPGIGPNHVSRVFERFYRVDPDRGRNHGGTGLGLAIVKHVLERHEGTVRVESRLGEGAEFICEWPCAERFPPETPQTPG